ncbi:DUF1549 domain-containing protein [Tautonia sociabilis]|uniref:DUF1549 domain-containing protein n=1 Tax=Tautonia sociabilis TaxID=2080755 RepID=A0A432MHJ1_9BACT|nr:DUF1549 domain-containing protein [Tautonia sociabilis]RUL86306.1 DUF1549 domain-containing protein [Tautonia sociabilis]
MAISRWQALGLLGLGATALSLTISGRLDAQQRPRPGASPGGRIAPDRAEAMEIVRALQDLAGAVEREQARLRAQAGQVERPEKVVTPPSLTAEQLDAMVRSALGGTEPAPVADDETFLRRLWLDLVDAPPTPEQIQAFKADDDPGKRARMIDLLLDDDRFAASRARYWRDVIRYRATFEQPRLVNFPQLESWLAEQFRKNRPWDEIATDLIAGTGPTTEAGNVSFAAAHLDGRQGVSAPEFAGEVSRIFLGVQIQCAQCHDHPTDPWTRTQFHEFAAFFAGTQGRRVGRPQDPDYHLEIVSPPRVPRYGMPDLDDPSQSIPVAPKFFLDASAEPLPAGLTVPQRRELAASYVTGQDNPWFSRAFVNRVWYDLMGDAFYLPIDDLGPDRDPVAPEVIATLADQWQQGGYDIRWLYRTILNTEAYQRQSASSASASGRTPFASNCPSRLRADQIADALDRALGLFPSGPRRAGSSGPQAPRPARFGPRFFLDQLFGVDPSTPADEVLGTIPQALFLMNSPLLERAIARPRGTLDRILAEHPNNPEALEAVYLQVLARSPSAEEQRLCLEYLTDVGDRREGFQDVMWALINSAEFISRR